MEQRYQLRAQGVAKQLTCEVALRLLTLGEEDALVGAARVAGAVRCVDHVGERAPRAGRSHRR